MRYRTACPAAVRNRQTQVLSGEPQLLLVHQPGPAAFVLGEQGKRTTLQVRLGDPHTCSCRQHATERELCDHLCWVLLRYLRLRPEQPVSFQLGISASDLDKLLAKTRGELNPGRAVATEARPTQTSTPNHTPTPLDDLGEVKLSRPPHHDDCCPVCLEGLLSAGQAVTYCRLGCGGSIHIACILRVARHALGSSTLSSETIAGIVACPLCRGDFATLGALLEEGQNAPSSECRGITKVPVKKALPALPEASPILYKEPVTTDCGCSVCGGSAKLRCARCSSVRFCGQCAALPDSLHVGHGLLFLRRSATNTNWVKSLPNIAGSLRSAGDRSVHSVFLEKTPSKPKSIASLNKTTRKRRRDALEAASVAAAVAAAAAAPVHPPPSPSSESNSASAPSTALSSSSTPSLPSAPPPPTPPHRPTATQPSTSNIAKPPGAVEAMPGNQLEQLQQLGPLLAALMADQEKPLPMPPPPPPPKPPPWRHATGVHACPALRLALRLGRMPDASSPTTPTASCALCGEELPAPTPSSSPSSWAAAASPTTLPAEEMPPSATLRTPQQGSGATATTTTSPPPRLAVTSITMPDVVAQHLPQPLPQQRCHQRRVRHLQRQRRVTFEGQSPKQSKQLPPKTASHPKKSDGRSSTSKPANQPVPANQDDSESEEMSLAARMRAMRLAAAGGDEDPGLPPPPWATSSTGCSHSECDSGGSGSTSGSGSLSGQATPMPTVGLRGLKLEPLRKELSEEAEPPPPSPLKLRRYLLREKLAKQRPRTAAAPSKAAVAVSASNARVATILPVSVDPVTMMGWVPPKTLTRAGVRASRPLLRTSNSTEATY